MRTNTRFWFSPILLGLVIVTLSLLGCSGDDGKDGIDGAPGAPGAPGADAIILADVVPINPVLDLSNTISYDQVSGQVTIHFFLTDEDGNGLDVTQPGYMADGWELRVYTAELIANNDGTAGQSWNPLWNERGYPAATDPADQLPGTLTLVDATTGEYTYVCDNALAASANVQRIIMRARWRETIGGVRYNFANSVNAHYDFLQSDPGTELASSGADMVLTANCETCHGARIGDVGHGGGYTQVTTCNNCHNINYMEPRNGGEGDLAFMIHRIHDAGTFSQLHGGADFSEVTYPQHINTCDKCHGGAPEGNLKFEIMTSANCQSCHDTVDANAGTNHPAGPQPDSACTTCHTNGIVGSLPDIVTAHDDAAILAKTPENISEYAVNISMTPPANGTHYVAGETPVIEVTLASNDTPPVAVTYTADAEEGTTDGALASANLFVYGPRSDAVPVLTTNSTTDGGIQQGHSLLLTGGASTDPQVQTDATGYKYQLMDNIGDLEPGTYMVRFEGEDYGTPGAPSVPEYRTASTAVINFQVGTADEEHKVSGDACTNCHGATVMHLTGAHPHHQPFNTDGCLACHDRSGNYGDYIGNRVHAVHSASVTGDLHDRDWSHVTFPQAANNCTICHTDTTTDTPVWRNPNEVACGGCHGADPLADPDLFPLEVQPKVAAEAAAATHMQNEGGTWDITTLDVTRTCLVCHGAGRTADLYDTHHLITFGAPLGTEP
jgi:OmcA/MtrC family decaheme c-type cytochrome